MKKALVVGGVLIGLLTIFYVNVAVYPFFTSSPNYSDVERVFNKMQFPSDWQEVRSSENRGIAGRACPIEGGKCFLISRTYKIPETTNKEDVKKVLIQTGCPFVAENSTTATGETKDSYNLSCSVEGMDISSTLKGPESEVYVSVTTP